MAKGMSKNPNGSRWDELEQYDMRHQSSTKSAIYLLQELVRRVSRGVLTESIRNADVKFSKNEGRASTCQ